MKVNDLSQEWNRDGRYRDVEEVLRSAAYDRDSEDIIHTALTKIVGRSSITQVRTKENLNDELLFTISFAGCQGHRHSRRSQDRALQHGQAEENGQEHAEKR